MLEQAGFTVDDFTDITWNDFMEKAKVVKEKTGQPILTSQAGSPDLVMEMLQSCGESLFNEDGSVNIVDNKALKPDRKSTRLNSSHNRESRMPSSA